MTAHFDRKISFLTSLTQTLQKIFHFISKKFSKKSSTPNCRIFTTFSQLSTTKPLVSPLSFPFLPLKILMTFFFLVVNTDWIHLLFHLFPLTLSLQKHPCITAHFRSSLHVKTCPGAIRCMQCRDKVDSVLWVREPVKDIPHIRYNKSAYTQKLGQT